MVAIYFADRNSEFLHVCVVAVQDLLISDETISDETSPYLIYLSCGLFHTNTPYKIIEGNAKFCANYIFLLTIT